MNLNEVKKYIFGDRNHITRVTAHDHVERQCWSGRHETADFWSPIPKEIFIRGAEAGGATSTPNPSPNRR